MGDVRPSSDSASTHSAYARYDVEGGAKYLHERILDRKMMEARKDDRNLVGGEEQSRKLATSLGVHFKVGMP